MVVESKGWDWSAVKETIWDKASPELYPVAFCWKEENRKHVLDLGCGKGRNTFFLARLGFTVEAFDISESGFDLIKGEAAKEGLPVKTTAGDMLALPYADRVFDAVLAFNVIYHTDRPGIEKTIGEIERVLVPGGEVYITFNSLSNPSFRDPRNKRVDKNTIIRTYGIEKGIPHYYVDEKEIRRLMKGFEMLRFMHQEEIWPESRRSFYYHVQARKL